MYFRKRVCAWCPVFQRGIYLSPSSPDSRPDEISLQEVSGSRDSEGSRYAVIPDMNNASSVEERGYEQLNPPPPDAGYTPLSHTCQWDKLVCQWKSPFPCNCNFTISSTKVVSLSPSKIIMFIVNLACIYIWCIWPSFAFLYTWTNLFFRIYVWYLIW